MNSAPAPGSTPADRLLHAGRLGWAVIGAAGALVVAGAAVWAVRAILPPLLLAGILVVLLNPVVERLHRRSLPRATATGIVHLGGAVLVAGAAALIVPGVGGQVRDLQGNGPRSRRGSRAGSTEQSPPPKGRRSSSPATTLTTLCLVPVPLSATRPATWCASARASSTES